MKSNVATPPAPRLSPAKRWVFVLVGFVLLPASLLALTEGCLRWAGYGYPTDFFQRLRVGTKDVYVENDKFGLRFFPPELARSPAPVVMEAEKPAGMFRIFLLGESAALGDPRPAYGAARYLQELLRARYPTGRFEVVCGAVTAIDSHAIVPIARECARREGDLWIVYMGNNEMIGPFGATTVFGSRSPPLSLVRFNLALQQTRLGQWLTAMERKLAGRTPARSSWAGMEMFLGNQVAPHDLRKDAVYRNFKQNLDDILASGRRAGVPILLSTVAVNLKDCAPFASITASNLPAADQAAYHAAQLGATQAEARGNYAEASAQYERAAGIDPCSADLQYQWAACLLQNTNPVPARQHFEQARNFDALPFRADSRINQIIGETATNQAGPDLVLSDAARLLAGESPAGIPGQELFYEHVHLNFDGNYRLARLWAEQVARFLPAAFTNGAAAGWATQESCERQLGLTDWNRLSVLEDMFNRLSQPPFTAQTTHPAQLAGLREEIKQLRQHMADSGAAQARNVYVEALRAGPEDHRLHENYAEFLEMTGDLTNALAEWQQVSRLIPQHHVAYFQVGRLLRRVGRLPEATNWLEKALALRPDLAEGWLELGNIHALQGDPAQALADYARERKLTPQDYRVYYHSGKALSKLHRGPEAIQEFEQALKLRPSYWEARYALGEELAFGNHPADARREFAAVIRQKPDYALAHLNLGVALIQLGDLDGAIRQFEETQRIEPTNQMALAYLEKVHQSRKPK